MLRFPNLTGYDSYEEVLVPIAEDLDKMQKEYPLTIIYMKLKYCGYAFRLFRKYVQHSELFTQYHAHTTKLMKNKVITQISKDNSPYRVIFATTALGMGVNTQFVENVIHITPPSTIESYFQEIGRAGRRGSPSKAILYYNNSDIASHTHVSDEMVHYCQETGCLRAVVLAYFGFSPVIQARCCSNCHPELVGKNEPVQKCRFRQPPAPELLSRLKEEIAELLAEFEDTTKNSMFYSPPLDKNCIDLIIDSIEYLTNKSELIQYGIWDDHFSALLYDIIVKYCPSL